MDSHDRHFWVGHWTGIFAGILIMLAIWVL